VSVFFASIWQSAAFQNALWLLAGIVVGALIQFLLARIDLRFKAANALRVMQTEIDLNLAEYEQFLEQLKRLKSLIAVRQISDDALTISMETFDYSVVNPLVQQGYFHFMLGADKAKDYFAFMRFFNDARAKELTSILRHEHRAGRSMEFLLKGEETAKELSGNLRNIKSMKLHRGLALK